MRISEFSVTNLFGIFDHTIPLNLDDRITIIVGPNGFGKTVLLRMLDGLFNSRYAVLRDTPFEAFRVGLDAERGSLLVRRLTDPGRNGRQQPEDSASLSIHYSHLEREVGQFLVPSVKPSRERQTSFTDLITTLTDEDYLREEALDDFRIFHHSPRAVTLEEAEHSERPGWLDDLSNQLHIRFIETQRLLNLRSSRRLLNRDRRPSMVPAVEAYSNELAEAIKAKLADSVALGQSLDRTFPARAMAQDASDLTDEELRGKLRALETKRIHLMDVGLLDPEGEENVQIPQSIDSGKKSMLSVYVGDVERKLGVYDEIAEKINLFKRIVNSKFHYKEMTISKRDGLTFKSSNGSPVPVAGLSSGEQHELVLLYDLLFKVDPGSLILIDEPELSLHVAWQEAFLRDLQEIATLRDFDVVIATHSPQIINDRWDLTVELKGPRDS